MSDQIEQDVELTNETEEALSEKKHGGKIHAAHDPKNAEAQSLASTDAAGDATTQAKEPGGAGGKAEPMQKLTKAGMMNQMINAMKKMKKADMKKHYEGMYGESVEVVEDEEVINSNHDEDLDVLIKSEESLSEGFKERAATIFEAAVNSKVKKAVEAKEEAIEAELAERVEALEEQYKSDIEEGLNEARDGLVEKIDSYLNYVVETWMQENKLAVEKGLRTEIAETFMNNLKDLFKESYIQVPESKVDLVDDLVDQVESLEEELNKSTEQAMTMKEEADKLRRAIVIKNASKDLADTQVAKLEELAEGIDFEDEDTFTKKIETLKGSYFSDTPEKAVEAQAAEKIDEATEEEGQPVQEVSSNMEKYLTAIRQNS